MIPERTVRRSDLIEVPWKNDYYMKWSEIGIQRYWRKNHLPNIINIAEEGDMILVHTDIASATVIAALWMRYVHDKIEYTWYNTEAKILYIYYGKRTYPGASIDKKVLTEQARKRTVEIIKKCFEVSYIGSRKYDFDHLPLFKEYNSMQNYA